jgi:hypothetical protein
MKISRSVTSKVYRERCGTRSSGPAPIRSRMAPTMAATLPCSTITAFGLPVVPEV